MSGNPELRIAEIRDGSLLDDKTLAMIEEMAKEEDFQVWVEKVGDSGVGVIIEEGEVKVNYAKETA